MPGQSQNVADHGRTLLLHLSFLIRHLSVILYFSFISSSLSSARGVYPDSLSRRASVLLLNDELGK
jgi:hypothetical protein